MSILVLLIAALHAIPIVLAGRITKKRETVTKCAWITAGISIVTGAVVFTIVDWIAIWIAWRWTISRLPESEQGQSTQTSRTGRDDSSARTSATLSGAQSVAKVTPRLTPIEQSDLDIADPLKFRKILDVAHEGGFRSYVESIHDWREDSDAGRKKASEAMVNLQRGTWGSGEPPYEDPFIAGAYQIQYQLKHCVMAFSFWNALFRVLSEETPIPDRLFVCDVGAGSDAGLIGLMLALMERDVNPHVRYVSIEPSDAMYEAGRLFRKHFEPKRHLDIDDERYKCENKLLHLGELESDAKIVTAFHLSWKYGQYYSNFNNNKDSSRSMKFVMNSICPDIYACTCHENKSENLENALNEYSEISKYRREKCKISNISRGAKQRSPVYSDLVDKFGFFFPPDHSPQTITANSRFNNPKSAMLHYGWLTDMEAGFVPDDDLPF